MIINAIIISSATYMFANQNISTFSSKEFKLFIFSLFFLYFIYYMSLHLKNKFVQKFKKQIGIKDLKQRDKNLIFKKINIFHEIVSTSVILCICISSLLLMSFLFLKNSQISLIYIFISFIIFFKFSYSLIFKVLLNSFFFIFFISLLYAISIYYYEYLIVIIVQVISGRIFMNELIHLKDIHLRYKN